MKKSFIVTTQRFKDCAFETEIDEEFKVPLLGIMREVKVQGVFADGVAFTESFQSPRANKVIKRKLYHSKEYFLSKMWQHRMPT